MPKQTKKRKENQNFSFSKTSMLIFALALTSLSSLSYLKYTNRNYGQNTLSDSTKKTFYPSQYSDKHITQNAINTDLRFKEIAFIENNSMLANTASTITNQPKTNEGMEVGTWLWTPILDQTPKYRRSIISGAVKNGIKNIYLSIDSYLDIYIMPDGPEKTSKKDAFDKNIEKFITEANKYGISVDAEGGWRNWAENGNTYKAYALINYTDKFNRTHSVKFRGFQYDVEPYLLDTYIDKKEEVLKNYLKLVDDSVNFLNKSDLRISVVIPEFYDGTNNDTPKFSYAGKNGYTTDHLLSILDRRDGSSVILMSYRNFSQGTDGSIDISKNEITSGNSHKTKIIIAQETGDVEPPYITFHNTNRKYFNKQKTEIQNTFSIEKSYGGVAIHYINAFMDLK